MIGWPCAQCGRSKAVRGKLYCVGCEATIRGTSCKPGECRCQDVRHDRKEGGTTMSMHPYGVGCPNRINVTTMMDDEDRFVCGCEKDPTQGARYIHLRPSDTLIIYGLADGAASNIDDEWAAQSAERFGCANVFMIEGNADFAVIRKELEDDEH